MIQFSILEKEFLSLDDELLSVKDGEVGWKSGGGKELEDGFHSLILRSVGGEIDRNDLEGAVGDVESFKERVVRDA